jgi:hypothetical protein
MSDDSLPLLVHSPKAVTVFDRQVLEDVIEEVRASFVYELLHLFTYFEV